MKKIYLLLVVSLAFTCAFGQVAGTWKLAPAAGSLGVGPAKGDVSWWSSDASTATTRACLYDDEYVFNEDGSFENKLGTETWIEPWQGIAAEACATPVSPHDGSAIASWSFDESAGTVTITGKGAFLGLSKVHNAGQLAAPADAVASITYPAVLSNGGNTMTIDIDYTSGWWHFVLEKDVPKETGDLKGTWKLDPAAGSLGVGPGKGDVSWWASDATTATTRACLFDDEYVFNADGSFENKLGDETWIEPWQGIAAEACATPVAPHDGSAIASWSFDEAAGTVTITGKGAFLGLSKVHNTGQLAAPADAVASITYPVEFSNGGMTATIDIDYTAGWWHFVLNKEEETGSVRTIDNNLFKIYPNPATDEITVDSKEEIDQVTIFDVTGKTVYSNNDANNNLKVDVSSFNRGIYFIEVLSNNKRSQKRLSLN